MSVSFWNLPGGDEDCARFDGTKGWLWSDTSCGLKLNYICQHSEWIQCDDYNSVNMQILNPNPLLNN